MTEEARSWLESNVRTLFRHALRYMSDRGLARVTPKFHMVDGDGKTAFLSCDFWDPEESHTPAEAREMGRRLEGLSEAFGAVASILFFSASAAGRDYVCLLTAGRGIEPVFHVKEVIETAGFLDFGEVRILEADLVKGFSL